MRSAAWRASALGISLGLLVSACTTGTPRLRPISPPTATASLPERLQTALDEARASAGIPGASAAVAIDGEVVWAGASGLADIEANRPYTTHTRSSIASITKNFTAALALMLVDDGVLTLDDPIERWLPSFPRAHRLTLRELLSHSSGLVDDDAGIKGPICAPGTCRAYADENYHAVGKIIEAATGRPIEELLRERVFEPFGLEDTLLPRSSVVGGDVERRYDENLQPLTPPGEAWVPASWAAGAIYSTPTDLVRWISDLFDGRVLRPRTLRAMLDARATKGLPCPLTGDCATEYAADYGLGIKHSYVAGRETWGHAGRSGALLFYFPEERLSVAIVVNRTVPTANGWSIFWGIQSQIPGLEVVADVFVTSIDGSSVHRLTNAPGVDGIPLAWSPDGELILFPSERDGNVELYVMRSDGSEQTRLTDDPAKDCCGSWTPDGRIVFSSERSGDSLLYVMDADGSDVHLLPGTIAGDSIPAVSPDGERVAFSSGPPGERDLDVMKLDGTERRVIASGPEDQSWPTWSPDGERIAYSEFGDPPRGTIWIVDLAGASRTQVPLPESASTPAWSPDGSRIAFESLGDVFVVAPDGSGIRRVTDLPADEFGPSWSPDDTALAFVSNRA